MSAGDGVQAVAGAELRSQLEGVLTRHFGESHRVVALTRRPCPYRTSFALDEIDLELEDGTRLALVLKNLSRDALLISARLKPFLLYDPLREIEAYDLLLASAGLGTATCYGAAVDPERDLFWLFLERVDGTALWQIGEFDVWEQVARWAAALHQRFAANDAWRNRAEHLVRYDAGYYRLWLRRAQAFAREAGDAVSDAGRGIDWLAARHEKLVERLLALPSTFIHGELYPSNVLVAEVAGSRRVCPIDWEVAAVGPAVIDLAALTAGDWSDADRWRLATAYNTALGDHQTALDELIEALDVCRLHLAVRWLGWAPDWSPPREHSQDWLAEAIRLAEKLDL